MENLRSSNNRTSKRKGSFSKFAPILAGALVLASPNLADAQSTSPQNRNKAEVSTSTILDRLNQRFGISLPDEYNDKVLDFVLNDTIMRTRSATAYTEEFIINEMKNDRGISKQNQLLFIRSTIYAGISQRTLYDRLDDDNETRSDEYEKTLAQINKSYEVYKKGFKTYIETGIADADRRISDADRRISDADRRISDAIKRTMGLDSVRVKKNIIEFYDMYNNNPNIIRDNEIAFMKEHTKEIIDDCKKYGIDYRAILLKEVGNAKKVDAILKFYGVE